MPFPLQDEATNQETHRILTDLTAMCRKKREILEFSEEFAPVVDVQNLLRNLGFFEVALEVYNLLESIEEDEDGEIGVPGNNVIHIVLLCNQVSLYPLFPSQCLDLTQCSPLP